MTTRTFGQDIHPVTRPASVFSDIGAWMRAVLEDMGPYGRRYALTGIGAACALGLGVTAALLVQLPRDMQDPVQAQDQTLVQSEPPSQAQARANALNNPPAFAVPEDHSTDVATPPGTMVETTTADLDEKPTGPVSTTNTVDNDAPTGPPATTPVVIKSESKTDAADGDVTTN